MKGKVIIRVIGRAVIYRIKKKKKESLARKTGLNIERWFCQAKKKKIKGNQNKTSYYVVKKLIDACQFHPSGGFQNVTHHK